MPFDVILFDWGGTLAQVVRQDELYRRGAEAAVLAACGGPHDAAYQHLITRIGLMEKEAAADPEMREASISAELIAWVKAFPGKVRASCLEAAVAAIGTAWVGSLDPMPGGVEALQKLRRHGLRMGLVSNCMMPSMYCRQELERQGYARLLDFAIYSSAVGYRKPSPKIYAAALQQAYPQGVPADLSRTLFVGDSPAFDVAAPGAMGMKTALVTCYKGIWSEEDYQRAKPDYRIDAVAELPGILGLD
jgi:putative hydrolase of the HAD superfamily